MMRLLLSAAFFIFCLTTGLSTHAEPAKVDPNDASEIKLVKIKADDIAKVVAEHKGKVIAIDIWANFCAPCKAKFPHLVKLHRKHAKDGLVCISISVDEEDTVEGAVDFLKKQGATFPNYWLVDSDEARDALEKKFTHQAPPIFHVYDRNGKHVREWEGRVVDEEIDELIEKLLKE